MFSEENLIRLINEHRESKPIFSAHLNSETVALMHMETDFTFSFFTHLANTKYEEPIKKIILFLNSRWLAIRGTSIAYTRHPFLPVNQLCLKIAEMIADEDQAVCKLLMPTISGMARTIYSLKAETEDDGHFAPEQFVLSHDRTQLIPVEELFTTAAINTNVLFPDYQADLSELQYHLKGRDFLNLERWTGDDGAIYIKTLKKYHEQKYTSDNLGFAIKRLAKEIRKGSVVDSGSEYKADDELIAGAIKQFYDLWKETPQEVKDKANQFRLKHFGIPHLSIECYFLALFVRHPDCPLSESELQKHKDAQIFPCAQQISETLDEFLAQYPELYNIMIHQEEQKESLPELKPLLAKAIEGLKQRTHSVDDHDIDLWTTLPGMMAHWGVSKTVAIQLQNFVTSYRDLIAILPYKTLFCELIKLIQSRLDQLNHVGCINKLFPHLSEDEQELILQGRFELIYKQIGDSYTYEELVKTLKPKAKLFFEKNYLCRLTKEVTSFEMLRVTLRNLAPLGHSHRFLTILVPRIKDLVQNENEFKEILALSDEKTQLLLADELIPWNIIHHFDHCKAALLDYSQYSAVQKYIITNLSSRNLSPANGSQLVLLMSAVVGQLRYQIFQQYSYLIDDFSLLKHSLDLIDDADRAQFLFQMTNHELIANTEDLKKLAALMPSYKEAKAAIDTFSKEKFKYTPDELYELNDWLRQIWMDKDIQELKELITQKHAQREKIFSASSLFGGHVLKSPVEIKELTLIPLLENSFSSEQEQRNCLNEIAFHSENKDLADKAQEFLNNYFTAEKICVITSKYNVQHIIDKLSYVLRSHKSEEVRFIFWMAPNHPPIIEALIKRLKTCDESDKAIEKNLLWARQRLSSNNEGQASRIYKLINEILSGENTPTSLTFMRTLPGG